MQMIIEGKKTNSSDGKIIEVVNPATQKVVDTVPKATVEDIEKTILIAKEGSKIWSETPLFKRSEIIERYANKILECKEELSKLLCSEMGKLISASEGEIEVASKLFKGFVEKANHFYGLLFPNTQDGFQNDVIFTMKEPLGVVVCIIPFNFPVELFAHKVAPALVTGNSVIIKPATDNPLTIIRLTELLIECGVPGSVVQVVTGSGAVIGNQIVKSSIIDAISFTGSTQTGIDIAKNSANNLHRVFLELGGNDALIIMDDADLQLAVEESIAARLLNTGQTCCATKRFLVHNSIQEKYTKMLIEKMKEIKIGDPFDKTTDLSCLINEKAAIDVENQVNHTISQGAKCVYGGKRFNKTFFEPAILTQVTKDMDVAKDMEIFGPVFPIIGFDTMEEAIEIANSSIYGLMGGVISKDVNKAMKIASKLQCGGVVINGSGTYRTIDMPFGGYKMSGIGREGICHTLDEMTQQKTISLKNILK